MAEAKKATKTKSKKEDAPVEQPIAEETIITDATVDSVEQEQTVIAEPDTNEPADATAKAGKRSSKALKEAAEKEAKEERKASGEVADAKPKLPVKPTRSRLERRGKHFRKSAELIETGKTYSVAEAVELAKKTSHVKFDATVELHVNLGVDPRQADQNIRDSLVLPSGTGKEVRIETLSETTAEALFAKLDKGAIDFDVLIATPAMMPRLGKYARVLGPRGLMPNPKSGTVTNDIEKAVAEAKAGRVEYRVDSTGIVHLGVGKVSFDAPKLQDNIQAVLASIKNSKPQNLKGNYVKAIYLTTSMGPSIAVDVAAAN